MKPGEAFNPFGLFRGIFIPNALVCSDLVTSTGKILWAQLVRHAGPKGDAYPRQETLARELGLSVRGVENALAGLVKAGLIDVVSPRGSARLMHQSCHYRFLWHSLFDDPTSVESANPDPQSSVGACPQSSVGATKDKQEEDIPASAGGLTPAGLLAIFNAQWEATHGKEYPRGKNDFGIAGRICKSLDRQADGATRVIQNYLACTDRYVKGHPLEKLMAHLPTFVVDDFPKKVELTDLWKERGRQMSKKLMEETGVDVDPLQVGGILAECAAWAKAARAGLRELHEQVEDRHCKERKQTGRITRMSGDPQPALLRTISPSGGGMTALYQEWIERQVLGWQGWEGGLSEFCVEGRHWKRFLGWLFREDGIEPTKNEWKILNAAAQGR